MSTFVTDCQMSRSMFQQVGIEPELELELEEDEEEDEEELDADEDDDALDADEDDEELLDVDVVSDVESVSLVVVDVVTTPVPPLPPGVSSMKVGVLEQAPVTAPQATHTVNDARIARPLT